MSTSGWDEESWGRGRGSRNGRIEDDGRAGGRPYDRSGRGSAGSGRMYDSGERDAGRSRDYGSRNSSPGWERARADRPGGRGSGELRDDRSYGGRPGSGSSGGWERGNGNGNSQRSMRGQRPPREDTWEPTGRGRGAMPAGSSGRNRAAGRGGLWGDEDGAQRRRRPDGSDPRARTGARYAGRDVGALRRGLVRGEEELPEKSSFGAGSALVVIVLMFLVGAGAAYGYFRMSTPAVHGDVPTSTTTPASTASPSGTASPSVTASPHTLAPSVRSPHVLIVSGDARA